MENFPYVAYLRAKGIDVPPFRKDTLLPPVLTREVIMWPVALLVHDVAAVHPEIYTAATMPGRLLKLFAASIATAFTPVPDRQEGVAAELPSALKEQGKALVSCFAEICRAFVTYRWTEVAPVQPEDMRAEVDGFWAAYASKKEEATKLLFTMMERYLPIAFTVGSGCAGGEVAARAFRIAVSAPEEEFPHAARGAVLAARNAANARLAHPTYHAPATIITTTTTRPTKRQRSTSPPSPPTNNAAADRRTEPFVCNFCKKEVASAKSTRAERRTAFATHNKTCAMKK